MTSPADPIQPAAPRRRRRDNPVPLGAPRRLLDRIESAIYAGRISTTLFDEMVKDGRMPKPIRINSRVLWDIRKLDAAIDALDTNEDDSDLQGRMRA